jgi:hypothetical protein
LLALIESETTAGHAVSLKGPEPAEQEILDLMPAVMPPAAPTKAEVAAWNRLPEEERFRRLREIVNDPGNDRPVPESLSGIILFSCKAFGAPGWATAASAP